MACVKRILYSLHIVAFVSKHEHALYYVVFPALLTHPKTQSPYCILSQPSIVT
jgi:hypothetical protein